MPVPKQKAVGSRQKTGGNGLAVFCRLLSAVCCLLTACAVTRPTVKIGLVAPFEGRYREVGYEVIYAVRLAIREANAAGGVAGYSVELVSLDDSGEAEMAVEQARKLATDPLVVGVVGHWLEATTVAAAPEYASSGLPLLATAGGPDLPDASFRLWPASPCHLVTSSGCIAALEDLRGADALTLTVPAPLPADSADPAFADRYRAISGGVEPRFNAVLAYDAARLLLDAIARDIGPNGRPGRAGVEAQLAQSDYSGLSGRFRFGPDRAWTEARNWLYRWSDGQLVP